MSWFKRSLMYQESVSLTLVVAASQQIHLMIPSVVRYMFTAPYSFVSLWNNHFSNVVHPSCLFFLFPSSLCLSPSIALLMCAIGTLAHSPPEWIQCQKYWARPTTVWQLGVLFYSLLKGHVPFTTVHYINNDIKFNTALSTGKTEYKGYIYQFLRCLLFIGLPTNLWSAACFSLFRCKDFAAHVPDLRP